MRYGKINIVFIILILGTLLTGCKFIESKGWFGKKADTMDVYIARMKSIQRADSLEAVNEMRAREQARLDSLESVRLAEEEELRYKYHVILGSFKVPENADRFEAFVTGLGYDTRILDAPNQFRLVSALSFDNLGEAYNQVNMFLDDGKDSWVYVDNR